MQNTVLMQETGFAGTWCRRLPGPENAKAGRETPENLSNILSAETGENVMTNALLRMIESGDRDALRNAVASGNLGEISNTDKMLLTQCAAMHGQRDILSDLFVFHHLYATDPDHEGRTVLHYAAMSGDPATIRFAMDVLGFDPMEGDACGLTALDYASQAACPDGYRFLCERLKTDLTACYRNPVLRGFHPDPSVVRVGEDYYLVNSSFVFFPGLPIFHSRDLVHWKLIGHAVESLETSGLSGLPGGFGYWAPDISFYHGRFWVVATLRRNTPPYRLQMITSAETPQGPWSKPKFLELDGIDPSLFDDGDKRYILLNPGAIMAEISEEGDLISEPEMIYFGSARIKPEGPHLLKKDGWYYLFLAEGGTGDGHMETVMRSKALKGPYTACPFNPVLGRRKKDAYIQRSGHGKPVCTPDGRWYMVYLCGRKVEGLTVLGRETALDPVQWTEDGWPMVNELKGPSCLQCMPYAGTGPQESCYDEWIAPRTDPESFAVWDQNSVVLKGGDDPVTGGPCSVLLQRQKERNFVQTVRIDMTDAAENCIGCITGYYDEHSYFLYGARRTGNQLQIEILEQIGEERRLQHLAVQDGLTVTLTVAAEGMNRTLQIAEGDNAREIGRLRVEYLSDEGLSSGKRFTGAMLGMAAIGRGQARFVIRDIPFHEN